MSVAESFLDHLVESVVSNKYQCDRPLLCISEARRSLEVSSVVTVMAVEWTTSPRLPSFLISNGAGRSNSGAYRARRTVPLIRATLTYLGDRASDSEHAVRLVPPNHFYEAQHFEPHFQCCTLPIQSKVGASGGHYC